MPKFKVGDRIRRISDAMDQVPIGFETEVLPPKNDTTISGGVVWYDLPGVGKVYSPDGSWELVSGPVRSVTRQEIVGGDFGRVRVLPLDYVDSKKVGVRIKADRGDSASLAALDATELRAASVIFLALADALDA